jgi:hypothetical protein
MFNADRVLPRRGQAVGYVVRMIAKGRAVRDGQLFKLFYNSLKMAIKNKPPLQPLAPPMVLGKHPERIHLNPLYPLAH